MRVIVSCSIALWFLAIGCTPKISDNNQQPSGDPKTDAKSSKDLENERLKDLERQVLALAGVQAQISSLIQSDFATCSPTGNTADPLINKICKVAQAANVEARVAIKGELSQYSDVLAQKLNAVNSSVATLRIDFEANAATVAGQIAAISATLLTMQNDILTLQSQMGSAQAAIAALQALTASISGSIAGAMQSLDVGSENVAAGPTYETLLRDTAKTRINGYIEAQGTPVSLPSNSVTATSGSSTVTVTFSAAHGLAVGMVLNLTGVSGGKGFTDADVIGDFTVMTVPSTTTITLTLGRNATGNGGFGGSSGIATQITGRAIGTVWKVADGADVAVRTTTLGRVRYQFIIKANGDVCYSTTSATANFATINAGGAGITCK